MTAHLSFDGLYKDYACDLLGATALAVFDVSPPFARYRYLLTRRWNTTRPAAVCLGANPSKAGAIVGDQTVTKLCGFARRLNYGGIELLNLDALISTDPGGLTAPGVDPVGPRNEEFLDAFTRHTGPVIAMWGAIPEVADRGRLVAARLVKAGVPLMCFGTNKDGSPCHPARLGYDTPLVSYRPVLAEA